MLLFANCHYFRFWVPVLRANAFQLSLKYTDDDIRGMGSTGVDRDEEDTPFPDKIPKVKKNVIQSFVKLTAGPISGKL